MILRLGPVSIFAYRHREPGFRTRYTVGVEGGGYDPHQLKVMVQ